MQGFFQNYRALPEKLPNTIRFFDRKDFLSVYGEDALFIAETFNRTTATVKYVSDGSEGRGIASQTVNTRILGGMLKKLIEMKYSFEIWSNEHGAWTVTSKGSPGNFEELEEEGGGGGGLMVAVWIGKEQQQGLCSVGVSYVDALANAIGVAQFADDEDSLSNLESCLVQLGCRECLCPTGNRVLQQLLARADIAQSERKAGDFKSVSLSQDLQRLLNPNLHSMAQAIPELDLSNAMAALSCVMKEMDLVAETSRHGQFHLVNFNLKQFMRLDASAVSALNLLPSASDNSKTMNVYGKLNTCKTAMGARKLMQWILQPLLDVALITQRQDVVEALVTDTALRSTLQSSALKRIPDVQRLALRFVRGKSALSDVVRLYQCVQSVPLILDCVSGAHTQTFRDRFEPPLRQALEDFANFCNMVEATIDLDALADHHYRIKASFDPALLELSRHLSATMKEMKNELSRCRDKCSDVKRMELEEKKGYGWCVRVTKKDQKSVESKMKNEVEEVVSLKGGWYFRTSKMRKAGEKYQQLQAEYDKQQHQLVQDLMEVVKGYTPAMELLNEVLSDLDCYTALAHASVSAPNAWTRPKVMENGDTILKNNRHACLETTINYVANDVTFLRGTQELCILTGPNMGGKSTYARAAGVTQVLAQMGSFIPAHTGSVVCVCDGILCRVGASDCQLRGVSTFMAEMLDAAHLLRCATSRSLLILDELGRGTSTFDGFGLAYAISEHIARNIGAFTFFATHFHELTDLAHHCPTVFNMHVTAQTDHNALVLLYNVKPGSCDQSFGIHVAEIAKFPPQVIQMARRKAQQLESFDSVVSRKREREDEELQPQHDPKLRKEGEAQIVSFLELFRELPPDATPEAIAALKTKLKEQGNPFVQSILTKIEQPK